MLDKLIAFDNKLLLWLNSFHSPFWDKIMWFISGKTEWIPLYVILIGLIIYKYRLRSIIIFLGVALVITLADQLSVKAFKEFFERYRPTHNPNIQHLVHIVDGYVGGQYGFVSSHAANVFALATFLSLFVRNRFFIIFIMTWASLVSYSRIYLGVHYPADIFGGALLGTAIAFFVYFIIWILNRYTRIKVFKKSEQS